MTPLRLLFRLFTLFVLLVVVVLLTPVVRVWWVGTRDDRTPADVVLVLGASQFDGRPSAVLQARLDHARDLFDEHVAPRVLTVGGSQPGDRFTEAAAGRDYLVAAGLPAAAVLAVGEGSDTLSSVRAAAAAMAERGWDSAVVVTDPAHSLRARTMARDEGIDAVTSPARGGPAYGFGSAARYVAREAAAYVYYLGRRELVRLLD